MTSLWKLNHHQLKKTWDFWESFQNCKLTMPEAATAIFYAEEFFFLQAGWCNVCFINTMFLCLHFPQKVSMKIASPLILDKQGVFTSQFYRHSHASSCPICSSLDGSMCGYHIYQLGQIWRWLLGTTMGLVSIDSVFPAINSVLNMKTICTSRKREKTATYSADCLFCSLMDP